MKYAREMYRVHPSVAYTRKLISSLPEKAGRSFDEWAKELAVHGPDDL